MKSNAKGKGFVDCISAEGKDKIGKIDDKFKIAKIDDKEDAGAKTKGTLRLKLTWTYVAAKAGSGGAAAGGGAVVEKAKESVVPAVPKDFTIPAADLDKDVKKIEEDEKAANAEYQKMKESGSKSPDEKN